MYVPERYREGGGELTMIAFWRGGRNTEQTTKRETGRVWLLLAVVESHTDLPPPPRGFPAAWAPAASSQL